MANFLFVYRGGGDDYAKMTPQEIEQNMKQWTDWIAEGFQKGWMVDAGDALTPEGRVVNAKKVVTDGPFVESKEIVGGFSIVKADIDRRRRRARQELPGPAHRRQGRGSAPGWIGAASERSLDATRSDRERSMSHEQPEPVAPLVEHFFRREAGRLVSVLTRFFGWRNFDLVEEMVQATLLDALQSWQVRGVPKNPSGWVHRVAKNKVLDALRRADIQHRVTREMGRPSAHARRRDR